MFDDVARDRLEAPGDPVRPRRPGGSTSAGTSRYGHSGRLLGFRSLVRWLPDERIAIAILTNQSRTDPAIIARSLLRIALKPSTDCAACRAPI